MATMDETGNGGNGNGQGRLYLVGTGPGDADNLTLRALKIIKEADLVICGQGRDERLAHLLAGKEVREGSLSVFGSNGMTRGCGRGTGRAPSAAELEEKKTGVSHLIRNAVAEGKSVAVLDGGDPGIFGPQACNLHMFADLDPVVIPGLSCLSAANAALGMSVVGGGNGHSTLTLAAMPKQIQDSPDTPADPDESMVFFTMKSEFSASVDFLRKRYPEDMPVAVVICAGSREKERVIRAPLKDIESAVGPGGVPFEHLIYTGNFLQER